ncbi:GntR family transcriptional regulator [Paenibacillus marinisediminis]
MYIHISPSTDEPIYAQIVRQIRNAIFSGELPAGSPLPSIRLLAKELQISVITTKRAYEELEREGLLDSVVGKGSFVSGANPELIREQRVRQMESKLEEAIQEAKDLNIELHTILAHIQMLYEEDEQ